MWGLTWWRFAKQNICQIYRHFRCFQCMSIVQPNFVLCIEPCNFFGPFILFHCFFLFHLAYGHAWFLFHFIVLTSIHACQIHVNNFNPAGLIQLRNKVFHDWCEHVFMIFRKNGGKQKCFHFQKTNNFFFCGSVPRLVRREKKKSAFASMISCLFGRNFKFIDALKNVQTNR